MRLYPHAFRDPVAGCANTVHSLATMSVIGPLHYATGASGQTQFIYEGGDLDCGRAQARHHSQGCQRLRHDAHLACREQRGRLRAAAAAAATTATTAATAATAAATATTAAAAAAAAAATTVRGSVDL